MNRFRIINNNLKKEDVLCRDCGKVVRWKNVYFVNKKKPFGEFGILKVKKFFKNSEGVSFMTTREYNGIKYHLHYCYDCVSKHFSEIPEKKFPLNPATKRSQFLFEISDEDFSTLTNNVCRRTEENYIKNFGEEEGLRRWNEYCRKQSETNTFEYKQKKYGWSKKEFDEYNASCAVTLPNLIKKHGEEEGLRIWENYKQRQSETCSKEYFIETYGIKEGLIKWSNWNNIRNSNWKFLINGNYLSSSKIADEFFLKLASVFKGNEIYTNCLETKEYIVDKKYSLDYYDATLNIVVEFYGDYWHGNPKKYKSDDFYEIGHISIPFSKIWKRDFKRQ